MSQSGEAVQVSDVGAPSAPVSSVEKLTNYLSGPFIRRMEKSRDLRASARMLLNKYDIVDLGFEALDFRSELDLWVAFAERILNEQFGEQTDHAYVERTSAAKQQGTRAPSADLVKSRANQHVAPIKEAVTTLKNARDTMTSTLTWCQSLQKSITNDEFGTLFEASNDAPSSFDMAPIGSFPPIV